MYEMISMWYMEYDFKWKEIQPTWSQIEPKTSENSENLEKLKQGPMVDIFNQLSCCESFKKYIKNHKNGYHNSTVQDRESQKIILIFNLDMKCKMMLWLCHLYVLEIGNTSPRTKSYCKMT